jgi:hypothetical protein
MCISRIEALSGFFLATRHSVQPELERLLDVGSVAKFGAGILIG